jgi:dephospho-CoA kinase
MTERRNAKIIAFVGLAGTGRSAAAAYLGERGIPKVSFGDVVTKALEQAGLERNAENEIAIREKLRNDPAGDIVANEVIRELDQLIDAGQHKIVIDGLGSWDTYKRLKHEFPGSITVVSLSAPRHIRYRRAAQRKEHPLTEQDVNQRDYDEIEVLNKGGVIAIADYPLSDYGSFEQLHLQVDELMRRIDF